MARVDLENLELDSPTKNLHSVVEAKYRLTDSGQREVVQIDTYGSDKRQISKMSQTLQFDRNVLEFLLSKLNLQTAVVECDEIKNPFLAKLHRILIDGEKLYKPSLLLTALEFSRNSFPWTEVQQTYKQVCLQQNVVLGSNFGDPFFGLAHNDKVWNIKYRDESIKESRNTSDVEYAFFFDEDWEFIQDNKEEVRQFILDKWFGAATKNLGKGFDALFRAECETNHLKLSSAVTSSFCYSILAKPFTILTGLSGSGKTQIARAFSKWLCGSREQYEVIAVGADWTTNENLLGYPDALKEQCYRKPDNGALDLILRAAKDDKKPYFLILDEMNLSHVERYFADFLSAMESGEEIHLHDKTATSWNGVPHKLKLPKNLFVIGTVNVDETTYMFSPKVLDRANVIEFRVSSEEMSNFLESPKKPDIGSLAGKGKIYGKSFVENAAQQDVELGAEIKKEVSAGLNELFPELQKCGAEFGYRTAHEICRFIYFHQQFSNASLDEAIDAAIMQKILPKLHGSRKKLGPVLEALLKACKPGEAEDGIVKYRFARSADKIQRMQRRLQENGFTSFAEA